MAQLVMQMPDSAPSRRAIAPVAADTGGATMVHRRAGGEPAANEDVLAQLSDGGSGGSSLPQPVRGFMETRFGADFGGVRVHADARAAALSGQLSAQAFTVGRDIYFGSQQFQPNAPSGRELIAHELTHAIQQGGAAQRPANIPAPAAPIAAPAPM